MKTRLLTLLVALFALTLSAQATDEITSLKLTIRHNGGNAQRQEFPVSDFAELSLLDETTTSIIIEKVEVETSGTVTDVNFVATLFSTQSGKDDDEWRVMPMNKQTDGTWLLDMGDGVELVENDWLGKNKTKTFEFYIQAKNASGNDIFYNNGGNDYKVTFTTGDGGSEDQWKVKFYSDNTATLGLMVDGEPWSTSFTGNVIREKYYGWNPGVVNSLVIDNFSTVFIHNDGVDIRDVSLQYKVYEEGADGQWNGISANKAYEEEVYNSKKDVYEHRKAYSANNLKVNVTQGLSVDKTYVLDLFYQVVTTDGDYILFGKYNEGTKFTFSINKNGDPDFIESVSDAKQVNNTGVVYDLQGRSVMRITQPGIYIVNGQKVMK